MLMDSVAQKLKYGAAVMGSFCFLSCSASAGKTQMLGYSRIWGKEWSRAFHSMSVHLSWDDFWWAQVRLCGLEFLSTWRP